MMWIRKSPFAPAGALLAGAILAGVSAPAFADDWDVVDSEKAAARDLAMRISVASRPVGRISVARGQATVTRVNGQVVPAREGTVVGLGDIVQTETDASVRIGFIDATSFTVTEYSRISINEFVFDPKEERTQRPAVTPLSVLRGVFMWTSGLIGRENPDAVDIDTPVVTLGIRG